eukprot:TRINITY_DN3242_c1_g2_i1.p3 TRINITY_DN3242_c1_g2~~TRINITY_DN3242_c1_g2_i1.p3  ORF type:complete len:102 (+),score=5.68 TRINITY_DN3242_c1_g2_i1:110-415(+)
MIKTNFKLPYSQNPFKPIIPLNTTKKHYQLIQRFYRKKIKLPNLPIEAKNGQSRKKIWGVRSCTPFFQKQKGGPSFWLEKYVGKNDRQQQKQIHVSSQYIS